MGCCSSRRKDGEQEEQLDMEFKKSTKIVTLSEVSQSDMLGSPRQLQEECRKSLLKCTAQFKNISNLLNEFDSASEH
ncbi:hypothetical protein pb186bvf_002474 [Paramecium bursaria]